MAKLFNDILDIEDVKGGLLLSLTGQIVFEEFSSSLPKNPGNRDWGPFVEALGGVQEAELVFEGGKLYFRRLSSGYLVILMGVFAPVAMVRLSCNLLLPSLEKKAASKGLKGFLWPGRGARA